MHINFKYFIVSIGSIFLALGIGILVGSNLGSNETMQKQNEAIVKDIDKQFTVLKSKDEELTKENKELKEGNASYKKYIETNQSILTSGKLVGKSIGIISFNSKESNDMDNTIINAGGQIGFKILIDDSLFEKGSAQKINEKLQTKISTNEELVSLITDALKEQNGSTTLNALSELGYIKVYKFSGQFDNITNIVVVNGAVSKMKNKAELMEKPIVENLKSDKPVLVVQNSQVNIENLDVFIDMKVATINNIDQPAGQISLINCLSNDKLTGAYGRNKNNIVTIAVPK